MANPMDRYRHLSDELPETHYEAIGKFVSSFSQIDGCLLIVLQVIAGISTLGLTRALFGGKSTPELTALIRVSLIETHAKEAHIKLFDELADDIDDLRLARNAVAHRIVFLVKEKRMAFSDHTTRKDLSTDADVKIFSVQDLNDFSAYALKLVNRTFFIAVPEEIKQNPPKNYSGQDWAAAVERTQSTFLKRPSALTRKGQAKARVLK